MFSGRQPGHTLLYVYVDRNLKPSLGRTVRLRVHGEGRDFKIPSSECECNLAHYLSFGPSLVVVLVSGDRKE